MVEPLQRRSALESVYMTGPFGKTTDAPGITIRERRGLRLLHMDGATPDMPDPGHVMLRDDTRILWLGPDRYLLVSDENVQMLNTPEGVAVNDVSSSRTVLRLSGSAVRAVLAADCTLDLDPNVFKPDQCATTDIDQVVVVLDCIDHDTFDVYVPRGFAVSFWEWLLAQSQEYGGKIGDYSSTV